MDMDIKIYAKSSPPETLDVHTKTLLVELEKLKTTYGDRIISNLPECHQKLFWEILYKTALVHDFGKIYTPFQNSIRKKIGEELLQHDPSLDPDIPHNFLSPAFLKSFVDSYDPVVQNVMYQTIAYHHDRDSMSNYLEIGDKWNNIKEAIQKDIKQNLTRLIWLREECYNNQQLEISFKFKNKIDRALLSKWHEILNNKDSKRLYINLKGLLHRLDYAASAHITVEGGKINNRIDKVITYLRSKSIPDELIWQRDVINKNKSNIILVASTGIGKTEFAYLWCGDDKTFYTLPVRTSVNAMYERTKHIFATDTVGLLHSDSMFYHLESDKESEYSVISKNVNMAKQHSMPVSISTADQIFTAAFKYPGYERIYATMAYSKVIVDEIQSYDPEIAAIIIRGLIEITELGGRFCLMTATLPQFYKNELVKHVKNIYEYPKQLLNVSKHRLKIIQSDIVEEIPLIEKAYQTYKKVLVITNTVKKAREVFKKLTVDDKHILHSGFIYKARQEKEARLLSDDVTGIWVTTQLVEASLNIDFTILFTELSSLDSLIQRMGRILRSMRTGQYSEPAPNVYICTDASGIGSIYDQEVVNLTQKYLALYNEKLFSEEDKQLLIDSLFSDENFKDTKYWNKFNYSLTLLQKGYEAESKEEAKRLFRKIFNITVIPYIIYERNTDLIDNAKKILESKKLKWGEEKWSALKIIREHSVSIPSYVIKQAQAVKTVFYQDYFLVNLDYDELGIKNEVVSNFL